MVQFEAFTGYSSTSPSNSVASNLAFGTFEEEFVVKDSELEALASSSFVAYSTETLSITTQPFAEVLLSPSQNSRFTKVS